MRCIPVTLNLKSAPSNIKHAVFRIRHWADSVRILVIGCVVVFGGAAEKRTLPIDYCAI